MWINALQRERAARPIACTTYEDLTSLDLGALKRIAFHTLRLANNWARAEPRGTRLFAEPPDELRRRIEAYWSSACRLAECSPPEERPPAGKTSAAERRTRRRKAQVA